MTLDKLKRRMPAIVKGFSAGDKDLETRLREIGFAEGDSVEALHFGLINRNPMSVRLNGALIALRRSDAAAILIEHVNLGESKNEGSAA
jgi:ferrous iron transport protein A